MKLNRYTLHNQLNDQVICEYSKFKFGDKNSIKYLAQEMSDFILQKISKNKKYVLYTTNKFPTKEYYKKNSLLLVEEISKILELPLIIGEYNYHYKKDAFYDNQCQRKIHLPKINKNDKLRYKNYIFLMIDDSILTGTTLKVSLDELKNVTNEVVFFSVINLDKSKYSEEEANNIYYKKSGINFIAKFLNSKDYILTTHMLRTIEGLKKEELNLLFKKINEQKKKVLLKSFKKYIEKDLCL